MAKYRQLDGQIFRMIDIYTIYMWMDGWMDRLFVRLMDILIDKSQHQKITSDLKHSDKKYTRYYIKQ